MMMARSAAPGSSLTGAARLSALTATLCGVHCLVTPVLAGAAPFLAVAESVEWWGLAVTGMLGGGVTLLGPAKNRTGVLAVLALGLTVWTASLMGAFEPLPETITSPAGSLVFAGGMLWSARVCHRGDCESCELESP